MTRHLLDVASYQGDLKPADVKRAGFTAVNLKISHGLTTRTVHPNIVGWIAACRELGLGICTFHYFTADATGEAQAVYAHERMHALGLLEGVGHQMDVESSPAPAFSSVRSYLTTMTALLQRPVALYTGDWWWAARPGWNVSDLTPYLWAAPNRGYLGAYPGDDSADWRAGYGGWADLAIMQYTVAPLTFPDGTRGTITVSKSAIRDERVWTDLTGGSVAPSWTLIPCLVALREEFNKLSPGRDRGADGSIGDSSHTSSSDHTPDEISTVLRDHDADDKNEVHVLDIDSTGPWPESFDTIIKRLVEREKREYESTNTVGRLRNVIWNRRIASRSWGWTWQPFGGGDPHTNHAHFSARYTTAQEADTRPWGVEGDDMPLTNADVDLILDRDAVPNLYGDAAKNPTITVKTALKAGTSADLGVRALTATMAANATAEARRDAEQSAQLQQLIVLVRALAGLNGALTPEQWAELRDAMASTAMQAGETAAARVEAKVDALREHLGDDSQPA